MPVSRQFSSPSCSCHGGALGGIGDDSAQRFPAIERALIAYIKGELAAGRPFWISPELNDQTITWQQASGFGDAVSDWEGTLDTGGWSSNTGGSSGGFLSSIISVASSIGTTALKVLPDAASIAGAAASLKKSLSHNGIQVPVTVANAAVNPASKLTTPLLLIGGAALVFLLASR